ncbi:hypothetical protein BCON_0404g00020 [Botryotinia convoluta]|uniref:Uncharacterized protein n=1 Tax=Botryotinia convoluta TaxID=54673 RepID=A0A4Z1H814_9HELO|nr:hypothetical protein BCON_0404g00020 [Botryotinia convoluta]
MAVLWSLIYLLVDQQWFLISHIQTKYNQAGKMFFEDTNAWVVLCEIFTNILYNPSLDYIYLIVDMLNKCITDLPKLMNLVVQTSSISSYIKWIPNIKRALDVTIQNLRLCFELNEKSLTAFLPKLDTLYQQILNQIMNSEDAELYKNILAVVSAVYRLITLNKLTIFVNMPNKVANDYKVLSEIISLCSSFLTIRECIVFFVHQFAKEFLIEKVSKDIFSFIMENMHSKIFSRLLQIISLVLRCNVYNLCAPGISIDQCDTLVSIGLTISYTQILEGTLITKLKTVAHFLYWLEALSLIKSLPNSILMIRKLEEWVDGNQSPNLYAFINDAKRFALYSRSIVEKAPLQAYCSALVFAPQKSIVRTTFEKDIPSWIKQKPIVEPYWNAMLQTLEGHTDSVSSVAFSPDGKQVISDLDNPILLYTLAVSDDWITRNSTNILWLPSDYRTTVTAIHRDSVVLAQLSGRISFFGFSYRSELL